jgi:hypothetical protein
MDIGSILLILALFILVGLFISRPLVDRKEVQITTQDIKEEHEYSTLLAERDRTLDSLEELDFDYSVGKIPEEDYPDQRNALLQRGAYILYELDKYKEESPEEQVEDRLESSIAARRSVAQAESSTQTSDFVPEPSDGSPATQLIEDDEVEALIAARRRTQSDKSAGFCTQCGTAVTKSDRFCSKCGNALTLSLT